jgi:hypothetical protein
LFDIGGRLITDGFDWIEDKVGEECVLVGISGIVAGKIAVGGKRVLGNNGEEGEEIGSGTSDGEKRGKVNGERLLCRCLAKGRSVNNGNSPRSESSWLVIKCEASSFLRSDREGTPGGVCRSICLVVGAIFKRTPRGGLQNDTLEVTYLVQCTK